MSEKRKYTQNRELSWLRFNERVLDEAIEPDVPAFERLNFISIFTSNLDEFFMIRVGSLYDQTLLPDPSIDNKTGLSAEEQLDLIYEAVADLYKKKDEYYELVAGELDSEGISHIRIDELTSSDRQFIDEYFASFIQPILSPQIISKHHPFPHLTNKALYIALLVKTDEGSSFGIIPVPQSIDRLIRLPGDGVRYALLEDIVCEYADKIFDNCKITAKTIICVTRNADVNVSDITDDDDDFRHQMKKLLKKRGRLAPVRLEYFNEIDPKLKDYLKDKFSLKKEQIFRSTSPLEMSYIYTLLDMASQETASSITYEHFDPQAPGWMDKNESMISLISQKDRLLSFPYEQMNPFLQLIKEAASDPRVVSIKITIYRLAGKATLIDHLCTAAENGKEVTIIMELRARFDEANNINWSENLEEAGCTVIYGLPEYKVHSKICLITYIDDGKLKRITQIGTGNYNEKTAKLYTDLSLMTSDETIGEDAAEYFKNISIANLHGSYNELLVAPSNMKRLILLLIEKEKEKALNGEKAKIVVKINSLTDIDTIDALMEASQAGVEIKMIIRGISCLLPGVEDYTENVYITNIVGRFLEHSRVYCFGDGDDMIMYISSADFMTRNLNRRFELACPIKDPDIQQEILDILDIIFSDNVKARVMNSKGLYEKKPAGEKQIIAQNELVKRAYYASVSAHINAAETQNATDMTDASQKSDETKKISLFRRLFSK